MDLSIIDLMRPNVIAAGDGRAEVAFDVRPEFTIPGGVVQGGIVGVMLDMAMSMAGNGELSTASLHFQILRPPTGPVLTVRGRVVRRGRRIIFAEAEMLDQRERLVARGTQTAVPVPSTWSAETRSPVRT